MTATMTSETESTYVPANDALHTRMYIDFIYGFSPAPGIDLGGLGAYGRTPTRSGVVFRQDYDGGVAIANLGDEDAEVILEHPYYDLTNSVRTAVRLPAHSAEVLFNDPR
jgi:hypothetical protein